MEVKPVGWQRLHAMILGCFPMYTIFSSEFCKLINFLGVIVSVNKRYKFLIKINLWPKSRIWKHGGRKLKVPWTYRIHGVYFELLKPRCWDIVCSLKDRHCCSKEQKLPFKGCPPHSRILYHLKTFISSEMVKHMSSIVRLSGFESRLCHWLPVKPWLTLLTFLCFCKTEIEIFFSF